MKNVAVLVSGTGSILRALLEDKFPVKLVLGDRECQGLVDAHEAGIARMLIKREALGAGFHRACYTRDVVSALTMHEIEFVAMAGFMTIFTQEMFDAFGSNIISSHLSLLPAFAQKNPVRAAFKYGVKITGCTVFKPVLIPYIGQVLRQEPVVVEENDTEETLRQRLLPLEKRMYVAVLRELMDS